MFLFRWIFGTAFSVLLLVASLAIFLVALYEYPGELVAIMDFNQALVKRVVAEFPPPHGARIEVLVRGLNADKALLLGEINLVLTATFRGVVLLCRWLVSPPHQT